MHLLSLLVLGLALVSQVVACGRRHRGFRIVGGYFVHSCRFMPWAVYVRNRQNPTSCTASIISPYHILTAAHCIRRQGKSDPLPHAQNVSLFTGHWDRYSAVERRPSKIFMHPTYNDRTLEDDIAILELSQFIKFDECHQSLCLNDRSDLPSIRTPLMVTGWGAQREGGRTSTKLKWTYDYAATRDDCIREYGRIPRQPKMLCGIRTSSFCSGDSGGPLIGEQSDGRFFQYGVVSANKRPGCGQVPGLYARVSYYYKWIMSIIE